ncbi:cation diffusion facilitator family transporter [Enterococcus dongliensis]|uniref:Cation diffusion facilitator family transporter n=1 Tax=Enterococcus dongliensis TaxID=2559925 RepID=A0AAW8TQ21_9ENTE|nr:cation diffusion facilitator family transporter [Enterococcus dongliensis]MDT2597296.1 cation diffusion facilitator family transporter [Enterococcus dongliensis]MDT2604426.1 cation diffusion facilitator family transporter [Enterococcus dongliensis]MDT2635165.1 cation diffusion facilitator family transporter [Enterococcus dongliensis]MDT2637831.1 cation diffusion facilitator family transporter [Enterococcus dongliensis]MDT2643525.1 cation diffusion facilitator family transporter [Enterococcu
MLTFLINKITRRWKGNKRTSVGILGGILGLVSNLILFLAKFFISSLSGSVSIMADAMNNLSDTASSFITLAGFKIAGKPADEGHPYGHERFEYISGFVISILVTYVGVRFLDSSFIKILHPSSVLLSPIVYIVLILSILMKFWQSHMYRKLSREIDSDTLKATAQDSINDVYTTIAVLISAIIEWISGWRIDGYIGFFIALYIIYSGIKMIMSFISDLMGGRPPETEVLAIRNHLENYPDIIGYHDLLIHSYGPNSIFASVHIEVDQDWSLSHAHEVIDAIEYEVKENLGVDLVCHLDPYPLDDPDFKRIAPELKKILKEIHPQLRFHDLRVDKGTTPETIYFDLVVPEELKKHTNTQLQDQISARFIAQNAPAKLMITFDRTYLL